MTVVCTARQAPAPIEYLLRKAGLGQEESMPSSGRLNFMSQLTTKLTDRQGLTYETTKLQGKSPGAIGGSVQRLVRHSAHSISKISGPLCPKSL